MKLKTILKALLPYLVGIILTVAVIVFVLLQLSAEAYLVLLVSINVVVFWIWVKSNLENRKSRDYYNDNMSKYRDRITELEIDVEEIKRELEMDD